jgi:sec-independent protein translocase protein TatB
MLSLSPAKLLVILVVALIVLGPEKLPQVARQIGAAWHDLRLWRSRLENEVRGTFPNLPPTHEVAQAVRSPLAFLERLADEHERSLGDDAVDEPAVPGPDGTDVHGAVAGNGAVTGNGGGSPNGAGPPNGAGSASGVEAHNGSSGGVAPQGTPGAPAEDVGTVVPGAFPVAPDDPSMN